MKFQLSGGNGFSSQFVFQALDLDTIKLGVIPCPIHLTSLQRCVECTDLASHPGLGQQNRHIGICSRGEPFEAIDCLRAEFHSGRIKRNQVFVIGTSHFPRNGFCSLNITATSSLGHPLPARPSVANPPTYQP
jgi:hypothetical protein